MKAMPADELVTLLNHMDKGQSSLAEAAAILESIDDLMAGLKPYYPRMNARFYRYIYPISDIQSTVRYAANSVSGMIIPAALIRPEGATFEWLKNHRWMIRHERIKVEEVQSTVLKRVYEELRSKRGRPHPLTDLLRKVNNHLIIATKLLKAADDIMVTHLDRLSK